MLDKHLKFKRYWKTIGEPELECKGIGDAQWLPVLVRNPEFTSASYRIADDPHWLLRRRWIDSDFTLPIEWQRDDMSWGLVARPTWRRGVMYREAPTTNENTQVEGWVEGYKAGYNQALIDLRITTHERKIV